MDPAAPASRLLAFRVGDCKFGVPAERVREVVRRPALTAVPQAPESLLGLGNIRGEAIAVVSAARLLDIAEGPEGQLVVIEGEFPTALAIDRIDGLLEDDETYEQPAFEALLLDAFPARKTAAVRARRVAGDAQGAADERLALLSFAIGDQLFALPLHDVDSVVRVPPDIARFPHADAATIGSIEWRDRVVPLLSLAALLDLPGDGGKDARIVIVRISGHPVALLVDRIDALLRPPATTVDAVPTAILRGETETKIRAIHRPADGGRLVSILDADQLLSEAMTARLARTAAAPRQAEERTSEATEPLLLIASAGQRFAFPLGAVHQIARVPAAFTPLAQVPAFLVGLTAFRGEAVPVVDLSAHLANRPAEGRRTRLLIVTIAGAEAALLVDAVDGIVHAPQAALAATPPVGGARTAPFGRVITLEEGETVTLVLTPEDLFGQVEADLVSAVAQGSAEPA